MEYAFNTLGVKALCAECNPANESSRRVLEKLGFRYTHDAYYPPTGLNHPSYMLTAEKFEYARDVSANRAAGTELRTMSSSRGVPSGFA